MNKSRPVRRRCSTGPTASCAPATAHPDPGTSRSQLLTTLQAVNTRPACTLLSLYCSFIPSAFRGPPDRLSWPPGPRTISRKNPPITLSRASSCAHTLVRTHRARSTGRSRRPRAQRRSYPSDPSGLQWVAPPPPTSRGRPTVPAGAGWESLEVVLHVAPVFQGPNTGPGAGLHTASATDGQLMPNRGSPAGRTCSHTC